MELRWTLHRKYLKIQPFRFEYDPLIKMYLIKLLKKPEFKEIIETSYMIDPELLNETCMDEDDIEINGHSYEYLLEKYRGFQKYTMIELIGYHDFNWHNIFRATLEEVCKLIPDHVFEMSEKIYVTTEPRYTTTGQGDSHFFINFLDKSCGTTYAICIGKRNYENLDKIEK